MKNSADTQVTNSETIENNKLIAEFMGIVKENERASSGRSIEVSKGKFVDYEALGEGWLKYDTDWNWLMEVVEKINIMDDYLFSANIWSMDVTIYNNDSGEIIFRSECKWQPDELIKAVHEAVVEFIKWYNTTAKVLGIINKI